MCWSKNTLSNVSNCCPNLPTIQWCANWMIWLMTASSKEPFSSGWNDRTGQNIYCCRIPRFITLSCWTPSIAQTVRQRSLNSAFILFSWELSSSSPGCRNAKFASVSHTNSAAKSATRCCDRREESPRSGSGCWPLGFPLGNRDHCCVYRFLFEAFARTLPIPLDRQQQWRKHPTAFFLLKTGRVNQ